MPASSRWERRLPSASCRAPPRSAPTESWVPSPAAICSCSLCSTTWLDSPSKETRMSKPGRLNGIIRALELGQHAFTLFAPCEVEFAVELQHSTYDGVVFEGEHRGWDIRALRDSLQYLLNRRQIADTASVAPHITPTARIPANGGEKNQFFAKQALDLGCYGIVWPHISSVEEAYNAGAACRYQRLAPQPP